MMDTIRSTCYKIADSSYLDLRQVRDNLGPNVWAGVLAKPVMLETVLTVQLLAWSMFAESENTRNASKTIGVLVDYFSTLGS